MHDQRHGSPELSATERGHALPESAPAVVGPILPEQVLRAMKVLQGCACDSCLAGYSCTDAVLDALNAAVGAQVRESHECRMVGYAHGYMAREPIHEWLERRLTYLERTVEALRSAPPPTSEGIAFAKLGRE